MDKLYFEGKITDLYAEDYQYLQDSISTEVLKILRSIIEGELSSSVIRGFILGIDDNDSTKLKITNSAVGCTSTGAVISKEGILIESGSNLELIELSDYTYGTVNKVFVKCEQVLASYDRSTEEIIEGERKAIDLYDYSLVYNRQIDKMSVIVYTQAEYDALTTAQQEQLVCLGQVIAQGAGVPLISVDLSVVSYLTLNIPNYSITFEKLSPDTMFPQTMIRQTSTGSIDDEYIGTPEDLVDDLNKIRTQIKNVKGTINWDDYLIGVVANDPDMNELHRSGVFPNALNTYNYTLTSSGYSITIDTGKALIDRDIIQNITETVLAIPAGTSTSIGPEYHTSTGTVQETTFYLDYFPARNIVIYDTTHPTVILNGYPDGTDPLPADADYTYTESTGAITSVVGGDLINETAECYYDTGQYRADVIVVGETGISIIEGTPTYDLNPIPPVLTSTGLLPLYYLYRYPAQDYVEDTDIVDGRFYTFPVKEIRELGYKDVTSYYEQQYDNLLLNGDMEDWSSGTSFTNPINGADLADYWEVWKANGAGTAPSINVSLDISESPNSYMKLECTDAGVNGASLYWRVAQRSLDYTEVLGKTVSGRFKIKAPSGKSIRVYIYDGIGATYTTFTGTSDWQEETVTRTISVSANQLTAIYEIARENNLPTAGNNYFIHRTQFTETATAPLFISEFHQLNTSSSHKMAFFNTSTGLTVPRGEGWDVADTPAGSGIVMDAEVYMHTYLYTRPNDQFWILVEPIHEGTVKTGLTSETLTVKLDYETVPDSGILDGSASKTILPKIYNTSTGILPILITKDVFSEGITRMKLSITSGTQLTFWKILIGETDLEYIANYMELIWGSFNDLYISTAEYGKHLEYLDEQDAAIRDRLSKTELVNIEQEVELNYLLGKTTNNSSMMTDIFTDTSQTSESLFDELRPVADIMDDNDFNNNWKDTHDVSDINFKNGFIRPRKQTTMLEIMGEYDITGIGYSNKSGIVYDSTADCYWMVSNSGASAVGEITKLSKYLSKGKVEVMGRWALSAFSGHVWTGVAVDIPNRKLYVIGMATGSSYIYGITIYDSDEALGGSAKVYSGGILDPSATSSHRFAYLFDNTASATINSILVYDEDNLGYLVVGSNYATLKFAVLDTLGASSQHNIEGFNKLVQSGNTSGRSLVKYGSDLYFRVNDINNANNNMRCIYKINTSTGIYYGVTTDTVVRYCGRFGLARANTTRKSTADEGIAISSNGDLLEISSSSSGGDLIFRRSLQGALWAENQISRRYVALSVDSVIPSSPRACMVVPYTTPTDIDDYRYYTGDTAVTAGSVYIYRYFYTPTYQDYRRCRITGSVGSAGASATSLIDLATDGTYVFLLIETNLGSGHDRYIFRGLLSTLDTALETSPSPGSINLSDAGSWTNTSSISTIRSSYVNGLCYDSDNSIFYLIDDSNNVIRRMNSSGNLSGVPSYYYLPDADTFYSGGSWSGIAYNNGNIYVACAPASSTPLGKIIVIPLSKVSVSTWYLGHIHQDPSWACSYYDNSNVTVHNSSLNAMDFCGDDITTTHKTYRTFITMKVLEDPDTLQLHSFINSYNILLSNSVSVCTPIVERYLEPHYFFDRRDCPNKLYMGVGYDSEGFSILNLDEFLFDKTPSGKDRYNVTKIVSSHYKRGSNNVIRNASSSCVALTIERDIICYADGQTCQMYIIDLASGKSWLVSPSGTEAGYSYAGSLSERNDGKGYSGNYNEYLRLIVEASSVASITNFSAKTFDHDDSSDYNFSNPRTYIAIGTNRGVFLAKIDWDSNGNRNLIRIYKAVLREGAQTAVDVHLSGSGKLFAASQNQSGAYVIVKLEKGYVWDVTSDTASASSPFLVGAEITLPLGGPTGTEPAFNGIIKGIAPNSTYWKTTAGEWRHLLHVCYGGDGISSYRGGIKIVDVENSYYEDIYYTAASTQNSTFKYCDVFEDTIVTEAYYDSSTYGLMMGKKLRFYDPFDSNFKNNWSSVFSNKYLTNETSPYFFRFSTASNLKKTVVCSANTLRTLCCASDTGIQLFHFPYYNYCIHISNTKEVNNPEGCVYVQHKLSGYGD